MGSKQRRHMKSNSWITFRTITLALILAPLTSSSPVRDHQASSPDEVTSDDEGWLMTSEETGRSHLVMWMMTEKQLIPQVKALAESATSLLRCTCGEDGLPGAEECLALAASLPVIPGLSDVPSQQVLQKENKKIFVKRLLENAYRSLEEVQRMLRDHVTSEGLGGCGGSHSGRHFMDSLQTAVMQYQNVMTSFYKSKEPHSGGTAVEVKVPRTEFSSDRALAIKLLYVAVHHLNQVSSALEYSVQFSWFSRMSAGFFIKGYKRTGGDGARRDNRKKKNGRQ